MGRLVPDETEELIENLINSELTKVSVSIDGWSSLYVEEATKNYWDLSFHNSDTHGGGPRCLKRIEGDELASKYPNYKVN